MISADLNALMTLTGAGSAAGAVLRQYWQPAALAEEFDGERPVVAVSLLGEELVAFKTPDGGYGLLDKRCPHRGVDLRYGRLEDRGLRCPFHGWLLDAAGHCLEQPVSPRKPMRERQRALLLIDAAQELKAERILLYDLQGRSSVTDYIVVCNGRKNPLS